ncbi:MAG: thioredoxin domain-containing protein, partial [Gemmatimonadaceae bacterium]
RDLRDATVKWFWDDGLGAFFDTASDHEQLITRPRDVTDNATPSGTSLAVELSLRLATLFDDDAHRRRAERALAALADGMGRMPLAFGHLLVAADLAVRGATELAIVGDPETEEFQALVAVAAHRFVPALVQVGGRSDQNADVPLLADRTAPAGPAAYLCRHYVCQMPAPDPTTLAAQLDAAVAR